MKYVGTVVQDTTGYVEMTIFLYKSKLLVGIISAG